MVGIKLAPWGTAAFFHPPAGVMRNSTIGLAEISDRGFPDVGDELSDAKSDACVAATLDTMLRKRLARVSARASARLAVVAATLVESPWVSVDAWARAMGCSARTLERHFDRYVGIAPKEFTRIRRFQRALRFATARSRVRWAAVAAYAGYADHSHLVRDFRQFAGCTPSQTLLAPGEITATFADDADAP
jgi:AraC-like DNA-binding protein